MLFDSHAHINIETYTDEERLDVIKSIEASDVGYVVDIGFDVPSSEVAAYHARKYPWCFAAVGIHPHDAKDVTEAAIKQIRDMSKYPGVVAIGEIGLDYHYNNSPKDAQRKWFRRQLNLALDFDLPVVIHDRESEGETLQILEEEGAFDKERCAKFEKNPTTGRPDARVLLHCYSGNADDAMKLIDKGATISIAGPVTYKKNTLLQEVAKRVPLAHMLIETDAPYLSPVPFRGKPNSSPFVIYTAEKIAELRGVSVKEIEVVTCENAKRFYNIK